MSSHESVSSYEPWSKTRGITMIIFHVKLIRNTYVQFTTRGKNLRGMLLSDKQQKITTKGQYVCVLEFSNVLPLIA